MNLRETIVGELLLQGLDQIPTDVVDLVIAISIVSQERSPLVCHVIEHSCSGIV